MTKTTMFLGAAALVAAAAILLPGTVLAYRGDATVKGPNYTVERHDDMTEAFANKDYNAWKALMGDKGVTRKITAANFTKFAAAHDLAFQGKTAEAAKIRAELGLGQGSGSGNGSGMGCGGRGQVSGN